MQRSLIAEDQAKAKGSISRMRAVEPSLFFTRKEKIMDLNCPYCGAKIRVFKKDYYSEFFCRTVKKFRFGVIKWLQSEKCKKSPVFVPQK
jgi:hypothetical protein